MKRIFLQVLLCCVWAFLFPILALAESGYVGDEFLLERPSVPYYATRIKSVMWSGQYSDGISCTETSSGLRVKITSYFEYSKSISCNVEYEWKSGDRTLTSHEFKSYTIYCNAVEINVYNENITMRVGQTETISYSLSPSRGASLKFKSSDTSVATVSYSGGEVEAVGTGTATITIEQNMGREAKCYVTVTEPVAPTSISLPAETTVMCYSTTVLRPTLVPSDANPTLTWKSSNTSIASVDRNGTVTGNRAGTATVTVTTDNGLSASCDVTVQDVDRTPKSFSFGEGYEQKSVYAGETFKIPYTVYPTYANYTLRWTSSDESIATVKYGGKVTTLKQGTARITATIDGTSLSDYCDVTVKDIPNVMAIWLVNGQRDDINLKEHINLTFQDNKFMVKRGSTSTEYESIGVRKFTLEYVATSGDVNGDGTVDVADIATVISVMAGVVGNASERYKFADVNGDGIVDVADIATVISIMAQK